MKNQNKLTSSTGTLHRSHAQLGRHGGGVSLEGSLGEDYGVDEGDDVLAVLVGQGQDEQREQHERLRAKRT